ncbi:hypothetical protein O181_073541 [Austropuccinia psidii MF-1]|uniref:Uncharacterized protein n=1 Tax=Austropuccinia psidii MF-1 TaxID=1389203 RepID=A0A9Q3FBA6_9BASI|nr:hypothetical protein [Austropuccinia psidii MF-1]
MEKNIQSNQMDMDKEEARTGQDLVDLPQERFVPNSPMSVPTHFDIKSEPEIIQGNLLRVEPLPSVKNRIISAPVNILVHRMQAGRMGNMFNPFSGAYELLLTQQEHFGSGEDHKTLRGMASIFLKRQGQKYKELVEEQNSFISRSKETAGNDPTFGERRPSGFNQIQNSPKTSAKDLRRSRVVPRAIKAKQKGTDPTHKGTVFQDWSLQP